MLLKLYPTPPPDLKTRAVAASVSYIDCRLSSTAKTKQADGCQGRSAFPMLAQTGVEGMKRSPPIKSANFSSHCSRFSFSAPAATRARRQTACSKVSITLPLSSRNAYRASKTFCPAVESSRNAFSPYPVVCVLLRPISAFGLLFSLDGNFPSLTSFQTGKSIKASNRYFNFQR